MVARIVRELTAKEHQGNIWNKGNIDHGASYKMYKFINTQNVYLKLLYFITLYCVAWYCIILGNTVMFYTSKFILKKILRHNLDSIPADLSPLDPQFFRGSLEPKKHGNCLGLGISGN